jgi:hypothetical protein
MQVDTLPVTGSRATQFFVAIAIVMVVFMAIGFGPSLYLRPIFGTVDRFGPHLPIHLIAHGVALTAWFVLFAIQTLLVRMGRRDLHRRLGVLGAAVAVAVVVTSVFTLHVVVARVGSGGAWWEAHYRNSRQVDVIEAAFVTVLYSTPSPTTPGRVSSRASQSVEIPEGRRRFPRRSALRRIEARSPARGAVRAAPSPGGRRRARRLPGPVPSSEPVIRPAPSCRGDPRAPSQLPAWPSPAHAPHPRGCAS